mmetsp:Transcript_2116/g.3022  ORF Transcript_2116/g.3022 Transcript_2116/m.3022 type:complete len:162 (+) Transcript_2116:902-1387(+)
MWYRHSVSNAWSSGMKHVDLYFFPCVSCGNPAGQVSKLKSYINQYNIKFGQVWLDIENYAWSSSTSSNQKFFEELANAAKSTWGRSKVGVYTSEYNWHTIMGTSYTGGKDYPLWYAHYQSPPQPNFNDFKSFGGWTRPNMKQYAGDVTLCSAGTDLNWYPN